MEQEQEGRLGHEIDGANEPGSGAWSSLGPLLLTVPLLVAAFFVVRALRKPPDGVPEARPGAPVEESHLDERVAGWRTPEGSELSVRLIPYRLSLVGNRAWGRLLAARFGLRDGEPWRLEWLSDLPPTDLHVTFGENALEPFAPEDGGPFAALARAPQPSGAARSTFILWGARPTGSGRLEASLGGRAIDLVLEPTEFAAEQLDSSPWRLARATRTETVPDEVAVLEAQLEEAQSSFLQERTRRQEREFEWYEFNRALARLELHDLPRFSVDEERLPEELHAPTEEELQNRDAAQIARIERANEVSTTVRALFLSQRVSNLDLLEAGELRGGAVGPVVFRLLDERGRLDGTLTAERLRFEASRAARSLTLVLEDGHEHRLGTATPFPGGVRRWLFHDVDPDPWIERMPELFDADVHVRADDGNWPTALVRDELNRLLSLDTRVAWYRLRAFSGVVGDELREVHVEELNSDGRIRRRLFADRMKVRVEDGGVLIVMKDGMTLRGDRRQAFLEGVHRIYLPNAPLDEWRAASLPGDGFRVPVEPSGG